MTIEELQQLTERFRVLHGLPAAVIISFEPGQTLFAIAATDPNREAVEAGAPEVLRGIANKIEAGGVFSKLVEIKRP